MSFSDLEKVMESVAIALKDAEDVLRTAVLTAASQDGLTDDVKESLVKKLELSAKTVEETIKVADSAAKTAKEMIIVDGAALAEMEKTAIKLSDAIDNTEAVTASLEGSEGGAEVDAVADSLKIASDEMVNDLTAVDHIAAAVTRKIEVQADAVLEMDQKASQSVGTINAAKSTIEQSNSETDKAMLKTSLQESADKIQVDESAAEELAKAITSDAETDAAATKVIADADHVFDELIGSVKETVDEVVSDYASGEDLDDANAISEELDAIESDEAEAEKAVKSLEEAEEKVSESAVEDLEEEQTRSELVKDAKSEAPEDVEPHKEELIKSDPVKEVKSEAPEASESPKEVASKPASADASASEPIKDVKSEASEVVEPLKEIQSESGPDSVDVKTIAETPAPSVKGSVQASDENIATTAKADVEKADTVEKSVSSTHDLSDVKQIEGDNKVQNVKLPESPEVGGGENVVDTHDVIAASADHAEKAEKVIASSSKLPDTSPVIESSGNVAESIEAVVTISAENHGGEASDHIEHLETAVASVSNVVEELASKTMAAGDSLADAVDSAHIAAPVAESVAHAVATVTAFSFLPF